MIHMFSSVFDCFYLGDQFSITHAYEHEGRAFVPNVPVTVKSIIAERTYAHFTEFLNPYL